MLTVSLTTCILISLCNHPYPCIPCSNIPGWDAVWLRLAYVVVKLFFRLCCRVRIEGSEHIPSQGGVVLVSNHISAFDTVLLPYSVLATQGMQIIWAPAKAELFRSRLLGCFAHLPGSVPCAAWAA